MNNKVKIEISDNFAGMIFKKAIKNYMKKKLGMDEFVLHIEKIDIHESAQRGVLSFDVQVNGEIPTGNIYRLIEEMD